MKFNLGNIREKFINKNKKESTEGKNKGIDEKTFSEKVFDLDELLTKKQEEILKNFILFFKKNIRKTREITLDDVSDFFKKNIRKGAATLAASIILAIPSISESSQVKTEANPNIDEAMGPQTEISVDINKKEQVVKNDGKVSKVTGEENKNEDYIIKKKDVVFNDISIQKALENGKPVSFIRGTMEVDGEGNPNKRYHISNNDGIAQPTQTNGISDFHTGVLTSEEIADVVKKAETIEENRDEEDRDKENRNPAGDYPNWGNQ